MTQPSTTLEATMSRVTSREGMWHLCVCVWQAVTKVQEAPDGMSPEDLHNSVILNCPVMEIRNQNSIPEPAQIPRTCRATRFDGDRDSSSRHWHFWQHGP